MKPFVMGSFCLLCGSDQTELAGHLVQTHYKKTLLKFSRMPKAARKSSDSRGGPHNF